MTDFFDPTDPVQLSALLSIIVIDIVMSGDNAIVIGMAVAGLPPVLRRRAIIAGIAAATVLRICFALIVVELLSIVGLLFVGGLLLAWVCWRMWRDIRGGQLTRDPGSSEFEHAADKGSKATTIRQALIVIVVADVSMSLDNVLAVGGASQGHHVLLVFGLVLSIVLMAVAANFIARLLHRHHWIAYIGLAVLVWVTGDMLWRGTVLSAPCHQDVPCLVDPASEPGGATLVGMVLRHHPAVGLRDRLLVGIRGDPENLGGFGDAHGGLGRTRSGMESARSLPGNEEWKQHERGHQRSAELSACHKRGDTGNNGSCEDPLDPAHDG